VGCDLDAEVIATCRRRLHPTSRCTPDRIGEAKADPARPLGDRTAAAARIVAII
jgi:hypothetical protein